MSMSDFLFHGDYPMDQIIYMKSGSFVANAGGNTSSVVAHGLTFAPLITGTWSITSNFLVSKEAGSFISYEGIDPNALFTTFTSDGTNVTITTYNPTGSNVTIYYRMYGFMPSNATVDVSYTASLADIFSFNPDYNYTKILKADIATAAANTTVNHNLGYRPQVIAWLKSGSSYSQIYLDGYIKVNNTSIIITAPSNDVHYRIYADGQL